MLGLPSAPRTAPPRSPRSAPSDDELGQVLALLRAAGVEEPERLSVAVGDRRLLALHRRLTGRDVEVAATCRRVRHDQCGACCPPRPFPRLRRGVRRSAPAAACASRPTATFSTLPADPADADARAAAPLHRRNAVARGTAGGARAGRRLADGADPLACAECGAPLEVAADVERLVLERPPAVRARRRARDPPARGRLRLEPCRRSRRCPTSAGAGSRASWRTGDDGRLHAGRWLVRARAARGACRTPCRASARGLRPSHVVELDGPDAGLAVAAPLRRRAASRRRGCRVAEPSLPPRRATPAERRGAARAAAAGRGGPGSDSTARAGAAGRAARGDTRSPTIRAERRDAAPPRTRPSLRPRRMVRFRTPRRMDVGRACSPTCRHRRVAELRATRLAGARRSPRRATHRLPRARPIRAPSAAAAWSRRAGAGPRPSSRRRRARSWPSLRHRSRFALRRADSRPAAPAAPGPPQVLIDRIEVITPPARSPAPIRSRRSPRRRVGASRHGGADVMAGVTAIQGVDDTLKKLTTDARRRRCRREAGGHRRAAGPRHRRPAAELVPLPDQPESPPTGTWSRRAPAGGPSRGRPPLALRFSTC